MYGRTPSSVVSMHSIGTGTRMSVTNGPMAFPFGGAPEKKKTSTIASRVW